MSSIQAGGVLTGRVIIQALADADIEYVLAVPDIVTSRGLLTPLSRDDRFHLVRVCKEDECVGIGAALSVCGHRSVTLFQNTGFLDFVNAIAHVAVDYRQPIVMIIGLLAREIERPPGDSHRLAVRIVVPILESLGVDSILLENDTDVASLPDLIRRAYDESRPLAILVGRRPVP